jgi:hypothetical protein
VNEIDELDAFLFEFEKEREDERRRPQREADRVRVIGYTVACAARAEKLLERTRRATRGIRLAQMRARKLLAHLNAELAALEAAAVVIGRDDPDALARIATLIEKLEDDA